MAARHPLADHQFHAVADESGRHELLQDTIRNGPIQLVSRGYGTCRVLSTGIRNVWSVQFFNAMDTIILDTLEVGGVPTVALAADEDFEDSAERLKEIIEAYFK